MILSVTLPFFALVFLGYLAARLRWVPTEAVPAFNGFLLYFAVPAMLYRFAANTPFDQLVNARFTLAWTACGVILLLAVAWLAKRFFAASTRDASFYGLAAAVGNVGFMGVPMMVALLGDGAAAVPILAIVVDAVLVGSLGLVLAGARNLREITARVALNPFIIAMALGALASWRELELPTALASIVKLLGDAAGPCALFAIGVSLVRPDAPLRSPVLVLPIAAKLLVHPALVWAAMKLVGADAFTQLVAVLVAGLPSAGWIFIFATRYGADAGRISATILLTTALAFASFSGLVWVLGIGRH